MCLFNHVEVEIAIKWKSRFDIYKILMLVLNMFCRVSFPDMRGKKLYVKNVFYFIILICYLEFFSFKFLLSTPLIHVSQRNMKCVRQFKWGKSLPSIVSQVGLICFAVSITWLYWQKSPAPYVYINSSPILFKTWSLNFQEKIIEFSPLFSAYYLKVRRVLNSIFKRIYG